MCFRHCYGSSHNTLQHQCGSRTELMTGGKLVPGFTNEQWIQNFRMSRETFHCICHHLKPALEKMETNYHLFVPLQKKSCCHVVETHNQCWVQKSHTSVWIWHFKYLWLRKRLLLFCWNHPVAWSHSDAKCKEAERTVPLLRAKKGVTAMCGGYWWLPHPYSGSPGIPHRIFKS